jgi:hypothetical protein
LARAVAPDLLGDALLDDPVGRGSAAFASPDLASGDFAFGAIGFFVALEVLVLLGRSDLFVPTSYLFFSSTV